MARTRTFSSLEIPAVERSCVGFLSRLQHRHLHVTVTFKRKLQECGKANSDFNIDAFFSPPPKPLPPTLLPSEESVLWTPPSRLFSDQMVNRFFQEWAPLFPVIHKPAFLSLYEQYTGNTTNIQDKKSLAQLNLVFGIAALSSRVSVMRSSRSLYAADPDSTTLQPSLNHVSANG